MELDIAGRVAEAEDEYCFLGCDVSKNEEYTIVASDICPDMWDSNHVRNVRLSSATDPEEYVARVEALFRDMGREHCRIDTDFRTRPQEITSVLRKRDYTPLPGVIQVYRGQGKAEGHVSSNHPPEAGRIRIVEVSSDSGLEDWSQMVHLQFADTSPGSGFAERAVDLSVHRIRWAWREGRDYRALLAYLGDESEPAGCCELFRHAGAAKIEGLFVREDKRLHGIGSALIGHGIKAAEEASDSLIYLRAAAFDAPRYMYLGMGFEDLMEVTEWLKAWGSSAAVADSIVWD
ncbi:MAG: GNAT family N-acetyltransferase [Clostridia bacterium]|nr:GNAT family N-acetyltransferase [Clostridia bacterium]